MDESLEGKVRHRKGGIRATRTALLGLAAGAALGVLAGARHELRHDTLYKASVLQQIRQAAVEGYAWKEGSDPHFYEYERPVLILDKESMTMQGYLGKVEGSDTILAGPIRKDGQIGYTLQDKVKQGLQEEIVGPIDKFKDRLKEGYSRARDAVEERLEKWSGEEDR